MKSTEIRRLLSKGKVWEAAWLDGGEVSSADLRRMQELSDKYGERFYRDLSGAEWEEVGELNRKLFEAQSKLKKKYR